jgi:hypothetical protein
MILFRWGKSVLKGSKKTPRVPVPALAVPPVVPVVPSLPPAPADGLRTSPTLMPPKSLMRKKAFAIIALRAKGHTTEEIATELGIKPGSVYSYLWRASRAGLFESKRDRDMALVDPADQVEFGLLPKAVNHLNSLLDNDVILERGQKSLKFETAKMITEGVVLEKFRKVPDTAPQTLNALKIEIIMPTSGQNAARAGAIGGTPMSFIDVTPNGEK